MLKAECLVSGRTELPHFSPILYTSIPLAFLTLCEQILSPYLQPSPILSFSHELPIGGFSCQTSSSLCPKLNHFSAFLNFSLIPDLKPWGHLTPPFVFSSIINLLSCPLQLLSHLSLPLFFHVTLLDQNLPPLPFFFLRLNCKSLDLCSFSATGPQIMVNSSQNTALLLPLPGSKIFNSYSVSTSARYSRPFIVGRSVAFKLCSNYSLIEPFQLNHYLLLFGHNFLLFCLFVSAQNVLSL